MSLRTSWSEVRGRGGRARPGPARVRRLLAAGAALLGLLVGAICALALWHSWQAATEDADTEARNLSILIDRNVTSLLDQAGVLLGSTAAQLERQIASAGIDRRELWNVADSGTALVPAIAQIGVFDAGGRQVCGEPASRCRQLNVADRDYFRQLRDDPGQGALLSGPHVSRVDGRSSLVLARSLRVPGVRFAGVVIAVIPLQNLAGVLAAVDFGARGAVALHRADLALLLRQPDLPATAGRIPHGLAAAVRTAPHEGSFRAVSPWDGLDRQNSYRLLGRYPLYIVVGLATDDFLAPWRRQAAWTLSFLVLFVLSGGVIGRLMLGATQDQQRIHELYDEAPCGYHSVDADGIFRRINATELRWLGCERDDVIGKLGPMDFFTEEGKAVFRREFPVFRQTGRVEGLEFDLVSRDGTVRRVIVEATTLHDEQGRYLLSNSVMHDISELHAARLQLKHFVEELEGRVEQRTRELRVLAAELDAAESRERRQVARDLHDDLGQTLAAARIHLAALERSPDTEARTTAGRVAELIDLANRSTRSLASQLAPPMLYDLGLPEALEWLGEEIGRIYGLKVDVVDDGLPKPLSQASRSILYRATRELLINVAKHARAEQTEVEIERQADRIVVRVSDTGVGFDPAIMTAARGQGLGLLSVRERLSFIGGNVEVRSIPGDGSVITLVAPLDTAPVPAEA